MFDGGAGTYLGTAILATIVTVCSLGIAYPFALVLKERWRAKHTFIDGQQLVFTGTGTGLFGHWIKWFLLSCVTLGIYLFWVGPRIQQWVTVNTEFAHPVAPLTSWNPNGVQHQVPMQQVPFQPAPAQQQIPEQPPLPQVTA
ncbi:MAG: DUF898 family protein [Mycetocola sp.]